MAWSLGTKHLNRLALCKDVHVYDLDRTHNRPYDDTNNYNSNYDINFKSNGHLQLTPEQQVNSLFLLSIWTPILIIDFLTIFYYPLPLPIPNFLISSYFILFLIPSLSEFLFPLFKMEFRRVLFRSNPQFLNFIIFYIIFIFVNPRNSFRIRRTDLLISILPY